jgi:hypothetical protein
LQPENEYTYSTGGVSPFPDKNYFQAVEDQYRAAGIVVPFVSNDASPQGYFAPGTGNGSVDIYGHDSYPLGFDCSQPTVWPNNALPTTFLATHRTQSPSTPYTISEFQGGSFDPWGGQGFAKCTQLVGPEFERVFFKNNYAATVAIFNLYMVYGGTNWGNLGHPGGYTSYDYGAIIAEDRTVSREKYSELKLQANFFKVSPTYLVSNASYVVNGAYTNNVGIATTRLQTSTTNLFIVRHATYNAQDTLTYNLVVPTSAGTLTLPQLGGNLTLQGRDSKIHVVDYQVANVNVLYSTAEVFTWKRSIGKTVLVLYSAPGETHEAAFVSQNTPSVLEGSQIKFGSKNAAVVANFNVTSQRIVLKFDSSLYVYIVDRYSAYNYWVLDLPADAPANNYTTATPSSVIVNGGYLLRTASVNGSTLSITGDINATTTLEVIGGAPVNANLVFNGKSVQSSVDKNGVLKATLQYTKPSYTFPELSSLTWKYIDSLPEIKANYDDSQWPNADHTKSNNTLQKLQTPTSLFGSDYGFNTGNLLLRGHFKANDTTLEFSAGTQGGSAFASAVWLNDTLVSSFPGVSTQSNNINNAALRNLTVGANYVLTVLLDNMGLEEDFTVGSDQNKSPRGILNYTISPQSPSDVKWKITGNLGGEDYQDRARGPLNEGGLYAERQGYHLPNPPSESWATLSPFKGITNPGVGFFVTGFDLNVPAGYDIPLSFVFTNVTDTKSENFRAQLYVNGYQFGKYGKIFSQPFSFVIC